MDKNFKFTIRNEGKSNAIGVGRLNKDQFQAVQNFMHSKDGSVKFPSGIVMVHQGSGYYHFLSPNWNEDPTLAVSKAIRLASKALYTFHNQQQKHDQAQRQPGKSIAYAADSYHKKPFFKQKPKRTLAEILGRKFRLKNNPA